MSPAAFAAFLRRAFALDTWYTLEGAQRALRRVGCGLTAEAVIGAAKRGGWVVECASLPGEFYLAADKLPPVETDTNES